MGRQLKNLLERETTMRLGLLAFGLSSLLLGLLMATAPGAFFTLVGPYGVRNDHFIHDTASFQIALEVLLLLAVRRRSWRVPALVANAIQWGFHTVSHLLDIGEATPHWLGYFDFFALSAGTGALILLAVSAGRAERQGFP
jgi:peptidoglycan/LPS O-acetylase OafA/YrhL